MGRTPAESPQFCRSAGGVAPKTATGRRAGEEEDEKEHDATKSTREREQEEVGRQPVASRTAPFHAGTLLWVERNPAELDQRSGKVRRAPFFADFVRALPLANLGWKGLALRCAC